MSTTVQLRIDSVTKNKAQKILKKLGLDLSSGIKMFLAQLIESGTLPLEFRTENGFTVAEENRMLREGTEARLKGKKFSSAEELFKELNA